MTTAIMEIKSSAVEIKELGGMIDSWLSFLRVSPKTAATYKIAIRQWKKYCDDNAIINPSRVDVANFVDGLIAAKKSASTIQLYTTAIKLFYRWTALENLYPNIADHFKSGVKVNHGHKKSALTAQQGGNLIKSITGNKIIDKRNRAIIALTLTAGLRTVELYRANIGDMEEIGNRHYLYLQGKGRDDKAEKILIAAQVYTLIIEYLSARGNVDDSEPLFISHRRNLGGRLSTQTISKMIKKTLRGMGLDSKRLSAHSLRHSAACQMILAGVELRQVQSVLRHRNINTTLIYLDEVDRLKNVAEQTAADAFFSAI